MKDIFRPMLAAQFNDDEIGNNMLDTLFRRVTFPVLASPKIDGIRFMVRDGTAMSRSWKPLPNQHFQKIFRSGIYDGLDGEVIVGLDPTAPGLCNSTQSAVMTVDGTPYFSLHVFDEFTQPNLPFYQRHINAVNRVENIQEDSGDKLATRFVKHTQLNTPADVLTYEEEALEAGYEGIMLRDPRGTYKFGRSTLKQQGLIKIKRFLDAEAKITGFKALERNTNPAQKNAFGLQTRSSHRAGKVADELLGKLVVSTEQWGEFEVGSGFDVETRETIWKNQSAYLGRVITFKYQPYGVKDKPRAPIFKGFRPEVE